MKRSLACAPVLFVALILGTPARADVVAPWYASCQGRQAGAACFYNDINADQGVGTCQNGMCVVGTATSTNTTTNTSTTTNSTTDSTTNTSTTTNTNTATNPDGGAPPSKDDGSCSIGKQATAKRVAPWLLAGAFSLLFLFGRRRRQS